MPFTNEDIQQFFLSKDIPPCKWHRNSQGVWITSCGHAVSFSCGLTPISNGALWCLYCGHLIKEVPYTEKP